MDAAVYRTDRQANSHLETLIARCEADRGAHMTGGACTEHELRAAEAALGHPLPAELRLFLSRLGGGVFYLKHEIFGARRVMIHDIELLPDLIHFRASVGAGVASHLLPFHRIDQRVHAIEVGDAGAAVRPLNEPDVRYAGFTEFLEKVVMR